MHALNKKEQSYCTKNSFSLSEFYEILKKVANFFYVSLQILHHTSLNCMLQKLQRTTLSMFLCWIVNDDILRIKCPFLLSKFYNTGLRQHCSRGKKMGNKMTKPTERKWPQVFSIIQNRNGTLWRTPLLLQGPDNLLLIFCLRTHWNLFIFPVVTDFSFLAMTSFCGDKIATLLCWYRY